ncbi:MAG: hypothetical protein JHD09_07690 [Gemmataceae bacterium]|nr:hypothetical protein [Gemmataceae bacterium]MBJ7496305.1 hypothetical protein [Gemmataceae bacterium]
MAMTDETTNDQPLLSKNKIIILSALLALLLLGSGYALYSYSSNSNLRQYQTLTADMNMEKMRDMPAEERKEYFENMKNLREKMTEPQKEKADDSMRERFQTQMSEKMNKFFALPPEERKVELDKEVDRMASMMKNFGGGKGGAPGGAGANAQGRGQGGAPNAGGANANGNVAGGGGAGGPNAGNGNVAGGANAQGRGQGGADGAGKGGPGGADGAGKGGQGGPPGGGGSPWGKGNPNATPEEKNKRTSDRLDNSTPEFRAQMTEYWKLVGERAKEKGVQIPNFGGGPTPAKGK